MSDQNKAWFKAVYSTHMSGYGEAGPAFHLTEQGIYESLQAEGLGDLPLIVLVHGKVTTMLSSEFEEGWMDAQQRLAALSIRSELIFAEGIGHAMAGENPDFVAEHILSMVDSIRDITPTREGTQNQ